MPADNCQIFGFELSPEDDAAITAFLDEYPRLQGDCYTLERESPRYNKHHPYERERGGAGRKRHLDQRVEATPSPSYHVEEDRPEIFLSDGGSPPMAAAEAPEL